VIPKLYSAALHRIVAAGKKFLKDFSAFAGQRNYMVVV
jgi:hypothetical protein